MKKGLLSILAGALLVVGCQNYDDQFSSLESQINALASTVAGLSQVQSDLASLSGTVSSLSSTVASLGSSIDTAVSNGLADITADIAALQAALADVASSDDLAAIAAAVAANQADLDELLANSSVYQGAVNINSVSTLETYYAMGSGLAIVNGSVDIDATVDMDNTKLQAVIDNIQVTTGSFDYQAASSAVTAVSFNNLTGTQTLTVKQAGDYSFQKLGSATNVFLYNTWKQSVDKIDFRELTSVTKFYTNSDTGNTIDFDKATELHLTKLAFYAPLDLTIVTKKGAAMPFILDDKDIDGDQANITLSITGPSPLTISNITDGTLTFANVAELTVNGFEGALDINAGVESFTADKVTSAGGSTWLAGATDLETLDITGATDPDVTTDVTGPVVSIASNSNIETVKLAGKTGAVTLTGNSSLTGVTISANVNGAITIGSTSSGNGALSSVTLTGSKATAIDVVNNADLTSLTIDTTFRGASASTTVDGDIDVVDNATLASLTITSTAVENLTVTGNDALSKVDFSKIATDGTTGTPDVDIYDNDLTASFNDTTDTLTTLAGAGQANDLGKVSGSSGIETIKDYLTHVDGATSADIKIAADTVNFTTEANATTEYTWTTNATAATEYTTNGKTQLFIAYITPNSADTGDAATFAKRSFVITAGSAFEAHANNAALVGTSVDLDSNNAVAISTQILTTAATAAATAAGVTMTATDGGNPVAYISLGDNSSAAENSATGAVKSTFAVDVSDTMVITVEGQSLTYSGVAHTTSVAYANAILASWNAYHATTDINRYTLSTTTTGIPAGFVAIKFTAKDRGTGSLGKTVSAAFTAASNTRTNLGVIIGNDASLTKLTTDNVTKGDDIVLTFAAATAGSIASQIGYFGKTQEDAVKNISLTAGTYAELSSTYFANNATASNVTITSGASANLYPNESRRNDVVMPEELNSAATSNATTFNRVHWLG